MIDFFFIYHYVAHKIAKDIDQGMLSVFWPRGEAAVTAESSVVPAVTFIYVFTHTMDRV